MHPGEELGKTQFIREVQTRWAEMQEGYTRIYAVAREKYKPLK